MSVFVRRVHRDVWPGVGVLVRGRFFPQERFVTMAWITIVTVKLMIVLLRRIVLLVKLALVIRQRRVVGRMRRVNIPVLVFVRLVFSLVVLMESGLLRVLVRSCLPKRFVGII
jgi:hypothetical protein